MESQRDNAYAYLMYDPLAHRLHDGRLCVGDEHKHVSIQAVLADPLVQVWVHVYTRTGVGAGGRAGGQGVGAEEDVL